MEMKFYQCENCGQIIAIVKKTGVPVMCCGKPMKEITPSRNVMRNCICRQDTRFPQFYAFQRLWRLQ